MFLTSCDTQDVFHHNLRQRLSSNSNLINNIENINLQRYQLPWVKHCSKVNHQFIFEFSKKCFEIRNQRINKKKQQQKKKKKTKNNNKQTKQKEPTTNLIKPNKPWKMHLNFSKRELSRSSNYSTVGNIQWRTKINVKETNSCLIFFAKPAFNTNAMNSLHF